MRYFISILIGLISIVGISESSTVTEYTRVRTEWSGGCSEIISSRTRIADLELIEAASKVITPEFMETVVAGIDSTGIDAIVVFSLYSAIQIKEYMAEHYDHVVVDYDHLELCIRLSALLSEDDRLRSIIEDGVQLYLASFSTAR